MRVTQLFEDQSGRVERFHQNLVSLFLTFVTNLTPSITSTAALEQTGTSFCLTDSREILRGQRHWTSVWAAAVDRTFCPAGLFNQQGSGRSFLLLGGIVSYFQREESKAQVSRVRG